MNAIDKALKIVAKYGFSVFPVVAGQKRPACWHGFLDASKDEQALRKLFFRKDMNIGIATGVASNLIVIDVDSYKPGEANALAELEAKYGDLPSTRIIKTRAGGSHLYYRYPVGRDLRSYNNQIAKGVDLRANGGYVLAEGSYVEADKYGPAGDYHVELHSEIAELPAAWIDAWEALNARQDELAAKKAAREAAKVAA